VVPFTHISNENPVVGIDADVVVSTHWLLAAAHVIPVKLGIVASVPSTNLMLPVVSSQYGKK
jgi:hypothetical protein